MTFKNPCSRSGLIRFRQKLTLGLVFYTSLLIKINTKILDIFQTPKVSDLISNRLVVELIDTILCVTNSKEVGWRLNNTTNLSVQKVWTPPSIDTPTPPPHPYMATPPFYIFSKPLTFGKTFPTTTFHWNTG